MKKSGTKYVVRWRHFAVLFCEWAECRHVFSLVESDRATRFESPAAAARAMREYNLRVGECEILSVNGET